MRQAIWFWRIAFSTVLTGWAWAQQPSEPADAGTDDAVVDTASEETDGTDREADTDADTEDTAWEAEAEDTEAAIDEREEPETDEAAGDASDEVQLDLDALGEMNPTEELPESADQGAAPPQEEWTRRDLDLLEVHGYFRVRPGLYHKFYIRNDPALYPVAADREAGCESQDKCATMAQADMRFLAAPTLNISEEVRVHTELMFFDNLVMGSSPAVRVDEGARTVAADSMLGYGQGDPGGDFFTMRRAWGEMESMLGLLRFGRMPSHWGLGMLYNSGDGLDDDLGDSVDRISFAFKLNGWTVMPAFDFPNEGLSLDSASGRPFDVSQLDDAYRIVAAIAYLHEKEDQAAMLRRGDWVVNTGLHFAYRAQAMSMAWETDDAGAPTGDIEAAKRNLWLITPDLWFQFLSGTFHLELEVALRFGRLAEPGVGTVDYDALDIFSWGGVLQIDYGLWGDQLRLGAEFGIASGDKDVEGLRAPASFDQANNTDSKRFGVFAFNPAYRVDSILYRYILGSVAGTYYFNPWLRYDFLNSPTGKKLGLQFDVIYSRALYAASTISDGSANLGIELNGRVDFATADNFFAALTYGVLFPLNGFKGEYTWDDNGTTRTYSDKDLTRPQTLRLLMGISF